MSPPSLFGSLAGVGAEVTIALLPARFELGSVRLSTVVLTNTGSGVAERPGEDLILTPPAEQRLPRGVPQAGTIQLIGTLGNGSAASPAAPARPAPYRITDDELATLFMMLEGSEDSFSMAAKQAGITLINLDAQDAQRRLSQAGLRRCGGGCNLWFHSKGGRATCESCGG